MADADQATTATRARFPNVGDVLDDRYELTDVVTAGGSAVVMRATQLSMQRDVAVKLLLPQKMSDDAMRARFEREMHMAKSLSHPNIVRFYDYGEADGVLYLVMELLEGETLDTLIKREGPLNAGRALDITAQMLDALGDAHGRNIIHRDLKPANIFLQRLGSSRDFVKLLDFGIARSLDTQGFDVTATGQVTGTVPYLSPEVLMGEKPSHAADVYAVGLILAEMFYGRRVFEGETVGETLMLHVRSPFPMADSLRETPLAEILQRATAKKPQDRFADASEFLGTLNMAAGAVSPELRVPRKEIAELFGEEGETGAADSSDIVGLSVEDEADDGPTTISDVPIDVSESQQAVDTELPDVERAGRRALWLLTAVLTLAAVGGGVYVAAPDFVDEARTMLLGGEKKKPAKKPAPAPAAAKPTPKEVFLTSEPSGAAVFIDGREKDETPARLALDESKQVRLVLDAHEEKTVLLDPANEDPIVVELVPLPTPEEMTVQASTALHAALASANSELALVTTEKTEAEEKPRPRKRARKARPEKPPTERSEPEDDQKAENIAVFGSEEEEEQPAAEEEEKRSPAELRAAAKEAFLAKKYRKVVELCGEAMRRGKVDCHSLKALSHLQLGEKKQACKHFERAGIRHKACTSITRH